MNLADKKCVPCEGGVEPMKFPEIQKYLDILTNPWELIEENKIKYQFKFKDFKKAIEFVNKVADIANTENHHPDITIHYNKVIINLSTHSIGGLSINDFVMASKIERLETNAK